MKRYNIPYNYVLVEPNPNNTEWMGLKLDEKVANMSVIGKIVAMPNKLRFKKKRGSRSVREMMLNRRKNHHSLDFGTRVEVKEGDFVLFYHHVREEYIDGLLVFPYDKILAVIGEEIRPVNGNVFIKVPEITLGEKGTVTKGEGEVAYVSKHRNSGYMWSDFSDRFDPKVGEGVYFNPKQGYPLEHVMHESLGTLVAVKRKDIYLTFPDPKYNGDRLSAYYIDEMLTMP